MRDRQRVMKTASDMFRQMIVIRHSEAQKTARRVHGGAGTCLTSRGRSDSVSLADYLRKGSLISDEDIIFTSKRPQALETAEILGATLNIKIEPLDFLRNISMGIFDGLTDDDARNLNPAAMKRLEAWREGRLSVENIKIPEAEDLRQFVLRVRDALDIMTVYTTRPIVIVTRSLGIAIHNLISSSFQGDFSRYCRVRLDPGSVTVYEKEADGFMRAVRENDTSYLEGERKFADD